MASARWKRGNADRVWLTAELLRNVYMSSVGILVCGACRNSTDKGACSAEHPAHLLFVHGAWRARGQPPWPRREPLTEIGTRLVAGRPRRRRPIGCRQSAVDAGADRLRAPAGLPTFRTPPDAPPPVADRASSITGASPRWSAMRANGWRLVQPGGTQRDQSGSPHRS